MSPCIVSLLSHLSCALGSSPRPALSPYLALPALPTLSLYIYIYIYLLLYLSLLPFFISVYYFRLRCVNQIVTPSSITPSHKATGVAKALTKCTVLFLGLGARSPHHSPVCSSICLIFRTALLSSCLTIISSLLSILGVLHR